MQYTLHMESLYELHHTLLCICVSSVEHCERIFNEIDFYASIFTFYESFFALSHSHYRTIYFSAIHLCTHPFAHRARSFLYYLRFHIYITYSYSTATLIRNVSESSGFIFVFALPFVENSSLFQFIVRSKFL